MAAIGAYYSCPKVGEGLGRHLLGEVKRLEALLGALYEKARSETSGVLADTGKDFQRIEVIHTASRGILLSGIECRDRKSFELALRLILVTIKIEGVAGSLLNDAAIVEKRNEGMIRRPWTSDAISRLEHHYRRIKRLSEDLTLCMPCIIIREEKFGEEILFLRKILEQPAEHVEGWLESWSALLGGLAGWVIP